MMNRKGAVTLAIVAAVSATTGSLMAETPTASLQPTVAVMDDAAAARRPLMNALDKVGAAKVLDQYNINIYGWAEVGYTYNHQHQNKESSLTGFAPKVGAPPVLVPFNHEAGDNFMFNQFNLRFERTIKDDSKIDVGACIDVMYGEDASAIHSNGLEYGNINGNTATSATNPENGSAGDRFHPKYQFDIPQAYITVSVGVKGLTFMAGKFYTLLGYETVEPDTNPFYSHSNIFNELPFTHTGILASYVINDQWKVTAGVTRGWDQATEDSPSCAIDGLFQVQWTPNAQWKVLLNGSVGPENGVDNSHYRTAIDPIVMWQATDALSFAAEGLYIYDGNYAGSTPAGYGDVWGLALYGAYKINDYFTVNARVEKVHDYRNGSLVREAAVAVGTGLSAINVYSATLGVTITPFPSNEWGSGLKIRPEIRYDWSEDPIYQLGNGGDRQQFTMACDVIYSF